ncbi:peptide chain release factor N(5)-glutamine methyltransferase [Actinomyces polynesiensis]|uniref:peptide chain release factor N(5)-glutamine methyltransferase n=1 Tax=Actinomyces polynesiensis TaxID=1325934 RepID=UPI0005BB135C|nr:peptide chain release factor N(5)-glutamine methyltransferase [Actinomyces polynesiensis]
MSSGAPGTGWSSSYDQRELLSWARTRLAGLEGADPSREARLLLEWALGVDSLWSAPPTVGARAAERFRSAVARRRHHTPLQHILGRMWFRDLTLAARPGVFVVRPETEVVAGEAIAAARSVTGHAPLVVDLCTGSGAIALAVATEVPGSRVVAVEIDPAALSLAAENVAALAPGAVELVEGDATAAAAHLDGTVDVVVSNPPYVPSSQVPTQEEALADPETALYGGGEDGLVVPRGIVHRAAALLRPGGRVVVEHAESQSAAMRALASAAGLVDVVTLPDLSGRDRMLRAGTRGV